MSAHILDGKELAKTYSQKLADEVAELKEQGINPRIVSIHVAGDDASGFYVRTQAKQAAKIGIDFELLELAVDCSPDKLADVIRSHNQNPATTGIILQVPLPPHLDDHHFQRMIAPHKDIEGVHPENLGTLLHRGDEFVPCTARAAVQILVEHRIPIKGKHAVVLGRSAIVGMPLALMLLSRDATVTICHRYTENLAEHCRSADLLFSAMGAKAGVITGDMLKPGAVVVDIATIPKPDGGITGDVDFASASQVASAITPVPGGVGPMTALMLLRNTLMAARRAAGFPPPLAPSKTQRIVK